MNAVTTVEAEALPATTPTARPATTPADMVRYAMESGADIERLERLWELQSKWEAAQAKKAYTAAMARFKLKPPVIYKDKHVSFPTQKGRTEYDHATIGNVTDLIVSALAQHGFSHNWIPEQLEGGRIRVTCVITHELGHSEQVWLEADRDDSGGKNNIQAVISTLSYLERHSLLAATGLATKDQPDNDGAGGVTLLQEWNAKAMDAADRKALEQVYRDGRKAFQEAKQTQSLKAFEQTCAEKTKTFNGEGAAS